MILPKWRNFAKSGHTGRNLKMLYLSKLCVKTPPKKTKIINFRFLESSSNAGNVQLLKMEVFQLLSFVVVCHCQ